MTYAVCSQLSGADASDMSWSHGLDTMRTTSDHSAKLTLHTAHCTLQSVDSGLDLCAFGHIQAQCCVYCKTQTSRRTLKMPDKCIHQYKNTTPF